MKLFQLRIDTLFLRFYLMMAIVLIAGFTQMWVITFLALPVFLSCLMGMQFGRGAYTNSPGKFKDLDARTGDRSGMANQSAA